MGLPVNPLWKEGSKYLSQQQYWGASILVTIFFWPDFSNYRHEKSLLDREWKKIHWKDWGLDSDEETSGFGTEVKEEGSHTVHFGRVGQTGLILSTTPLWWCIIGAIMNRISGIISKVHWSLVVSSSLLGKGWHL
jgi:hypothetical protein